MPCFSTTAGTCSILCNYLLQTFYIFVLLLLHTEIICFVIHCMIGQKVGSSILGTWNVLYRKVIELTDQNHGALYHSIPPVVPESNENARFA
jgi:hypothetical protein